MSQSASQSGTNDAVKGSWPRSAPRRSTSLCRGVAMVDHFFDDTRVMRSKIAPYEKLGSVRRWAQPLPSAISSRHHLDLPSRYAEPSYLRSRDFCRSRATSSGGGAARITGRRAPDVGISMSTCGVDAAGISAKQRTFKLTNCRDRHHREGSVLRCPANRL